nr:PREDICTED: histidine-containing phosphotransfer protein 2-like [Daucus carota subsp. sativus]
MDNGRPAPPTTNDVLERLRSLEYQGLLDNLLRYYYELKTEDDPCYFVNIIQVFLQDVPKTIDSMREILYQDFVNFARLKDLIVKVKGSANWIGALKMSQATSNLLHQFEIASKSGCMTALTEVKVVFDELRTHLDSLIQLELEVFAK